MATVSSTQASSAPGPVNGNGSAAMPNAAPQPLHKASLYVGDIHPDVTEALLFEIFNAVGPVASIRVCRDAMTRRSLGYAYVNFHNLADAERALDTMNYTTIKTVPCRIMWSQRDPTLRRSGVGNIFVKNLSTEVDNKALYDTFSLFGNILSCKVVNDNSGDSKGYGYVHYETAEAAHEAIDKINGMMILGQTVHVGQFQKRQERPDEPTWVNCFVKNMPKSWSDEDLKKQFTPFGPIASCVVMRESEGEKEGESKGFGFVSFEEPEHAFAAAEGLCGKKFPGEEEGEELELFVGKAQSKEERERELRQKFESLKMERIAKYQGVNLYVKNLDEAVTEDELRQAFSSHGTITSVRIMQDAANVSRGFGFVCFSNPEEATKAVTEMNGKLLSGKPIYVALAQRKEVRRAQLEAQHAQQRQGMPGRGMPMGQPPMYGAAPMFYAQPNQIPQGRPGFVYPQQMMARGAPMPGRGGPMPYGGRGGGPGYQMAPGYGMPMQRPQRGRRQGGPGGRGMPRGNMPQGGHQNRNFKYTSNVRNSHPSPAPTGPPAPQVMNMQGMAPAEEPLTSAALASASPQLQKNMIGERLYPLILAERPVLAGKITGMLLEMDNGELLHLLESPEALSAKIKEAYVVLEEHTPEVLEGAQE